MKFVVLSDTHLVQAGGRLHALDPAANLAQAVHVINRDHGDIAFVVINGDLTHLGECAAYEVLKSALGRLHVPAILLVGNHDLRAPFRTVFPNADDDGHGFVQSIRVLDEMTLITIDTLDEGATTHAGRLCEKRLRFLESALGDAPRDRPVLLFQHHPPTDTGLPSMDSIKLYHAEDEWAIFERIRLPDFMFFGHVHRPVTGIWRGIPFHIQRAVSHQVGFDLQTWRSIPGTHEPPDYSLVTVIGRDITILERSFLYGGPAFSLGDHAALAVGDLPR
jgi:3',5'-cyclic AMP phosphodiesterase CpdA